MSVLIRDLMNIACNPPDLAGVSAPLAYKMGHRDARHAACDIASTTRVTSEADALRAEVERLREALGKISTHREDCHAYDDECGPYRRDFDETDIVGLERIARAALKEGGDV